MLKNTDVKKDNGGLKMAGSTNKATNEPKKRIAPKPKLIMNKRKERQYIYEGNYSDVMNPETKKTVYFSCPNLIESFNGIKLKYKQFQDTDLAVIRKKLEDQGWKAN